MRTLLILSLSLCLTGCLTEAQTPRIPEHPMTMVDHDTTQLAELGRYTKAVKLEAGEGSLIGHVGAVEVDPRNGDLLVGDYRAGRRVYRFDRDGAFIRSYGAVGQAPGEYEGIHGFTVTADGCVLILGTLKILMFGPEGELMAEAKHGVGPHFVKAMGERIYLYGSSGAQSMTQSVLVFDNDLTPLDFFHPYDQRLERFPMVPFQGLAVAEGNVYVSAFLDFELTVYDPLGTPLGRYRFPNVNDELEPLWARRGLEFDASQKRQLAQGLHRIRSVYAVGDRLFFMEANFSNDIYRPCLLDPVTHRLDRYPGLRPMVNRGEPGYVTFREVVGASGNALIGVVEDSDRFEKTKHLDPVTAGIQLSDDDNPLLLFFELNLPGGQS